MFSEGSKPTLCKPERSVTVPRIHPQSVPLQSPSKGLWETVWMDSKQNKTHLITSFIMNLGFFRAGDVTRLWHAGKGRGLLSMLEAHVNWCVLQASPLTSHKTLSAFGFHELERPPCPSPLSEVVSNQRWIFVICKGSFRCHIIARLSMNVSVWKLRDLSQPLPTIYFLGVEYIRAWWLQVPPMEEQNRPPLELAKNQNAPFCWILICIFLQDPRMICVDLHLKVWKVSR